LTHGQSWSGCRSALAEAWRESSRTLPATIEVPTADDIWSAAALKGRFPIAYADGFAAALAQKYNCPLVTGDPEFRRVDQLELDWIGGGEVPHQAVPFFLFLMPG